MAGRLGRCNDLVAEGYRVGRVGAEGLDFLVAPPLQPTRCCIPSRRLRQSLPTNLPEATYDVDPVTGPSWLGSPSARAQAIQHPELGRLVKPSPTGPTPAIHPIGIMFCACWRGAIEAGHRESAWTFGSLRSFSLRGR